jgi:PDZ domain-containing protein
VGGLEDQPSEPTQATPEHPWAAPTSGLTTSPQTGYGHENPDTKIPWSKRHRKASLAIVLVLALLLVVVVASPFIKLDYYSISPGAGKPVDKLIHFPPSKSYPTKGNILFTYVELGRVTLATLLPDLLSSHTRLVKQVEITGGAPPSQLEAQGLVEMMESHQYATAAALTALGYKVSSQDWGGVIEAVFPHTPAYPKLAVGDVIEQVNGVPTPDPALVVSNLDSTKPGEEVTLKIGDLFKPSQKARTMTFHMIASPFEIHGHRVGFLGVSLGQHPAERFVFPFPVKIDTGDIGGPSAGLAMTLGIIDELVKGGLTGGVKVAATGTIDPEGRVGPVGGVAEKAVAISRAGAKFFLVPVEEAKTAREHVFKGVKVDPVTTLSQALSDLARIRCRAEPSRCNLSLQASKGLG